MAVDDLDKPLGSEPNPSAPRVSVSPPMLVAGALLLLIAVGTGWVLFVKDPRGGEPRAIATIEESKTPAAPGTLAPPSSTIAAPAPQAPSQIATTPRAPSRTITVIDGRTGERREVVLGPADEPETVGTITPRPATPSPSATDPKLTEPSRHGVIPRVGIDGKRPLDRYARIDPALEKARGPRIAIIVTGLGIGAGATGNALNTLPANVTLAFAPYGADLTRWTGSARTKGHEILLQIPMEPVDYPDNDPGPQTLISALTTEQNLDRLHWLLSRTQGYIGVMNLMGARFLAAESALSPVLRDIAGRGLLYLDDGTTPRSTAATVAGAIQAPFLKADLVLDTNPNWNEIDTMLAKLEAIAAERGSAVGIASPLPVSIERIARWAKAAEARGIRLVPLSMVLARLKQQG